jgi:hypothetical protein
MVLFRKEFYFYDLQLDIVVHVRSFETLTNGLDDALN